RAGRAPTPGSRRCSLLACPAGVALAGGVLGRGLERLAPGRDPLLVDLDHARVADVDLPRAGRAPADDVPAPVDPRRADVLRRALKQAAVGPAARDRDRGAVALTHRGHSFLAHAGPGQFDAGRPSIPAISASCTAASGSGGSASPAEARSQICVITPSGE